MMVMKIKNASAVKNIHFINGGKTIFFIQKKLKDIEIFDEIFMRKGKCKYLAIEFKQWLFLW